MFTVKLNDEVITVTSNRADAVACFLGTASVSISNYRDLSLDDMSKIVEQGFVEHDGEKITLVEED